MSMENLEKQIKHPFYKEVDDFREEIKRETLVKASMKYEEPFNPSSWTGEELAKHAMMENYDQSVYITGMREHIRDLEHQVSWHLDTIEKLKKEKQALLTRGES